LLLSRQPFSGFVHGPYGHNANTEMLEETLPTLKEEEDKEDKEEKERRRRKKYTHVEMPRVIFAKH